MKRNKKRVKSRVLKGEKKKTVRRKRNRSKEENERERKRRERTCSSL